MKVERKVAWSRGTLMLPQHLQQLDRYHESLLTARLDALDPYAFGVVRCVLDAHALRAAEGKVVLETFQGVLPDGTMLSISPERGTHPAPAPFAVSVNDLPASGQPLPVFLAVARERPGADNYGLNGEPTDGLRYNVLKADVSDRARNDRVDQLSLAAPATKLFIGTRNFASENFDLLKIAEIVHTNNGIAYAEGYVPPCLQIRAAPGLVDRIKGLRARMMERHSALTARRRETDDGRIEYTSVDVTRFLLLNAINASLPVLHHLTSPGDVSPRTTFLMLCQLVGQLATFSTEVDMKQPLDFRFDDLQRTFETVIELAEELLRLTDVQHYVACPLGLNDGLFRASLLDTRMRNGRRYVLAVKSDIARDRIVREFEQNAKISNSQFMRQLRKGAFGGVPVSAITDDDMDPQRRLPVQIERQRGWVYFNLPQPNQYTSGAARWEDYWSGIWQASEIVVWVPEDIAANSEVKLLRVLDAAPT